MTVAAIYTRNALTNPQKIQEQREYCESVAFKYGYEVLATRYDDDGYTGDTSDRPAFKKLRADSLTGLFDVVIVTDLARLARDTETGLAVMEEFRKRGVKVISALRDAIGDWMVRP